MKNVRLFELLDNIDDKYIVDAQIKPAPVAVFASENPFFNFFRNAVSVAAIFLVIGVIFVWTLVGKEILNAYHGSDTISETTTTDPQTTPDPSITTDNGIIPSIPSTDTTTKPWHTTVPITTTAPTTTTAPNIQTPESGNTDITDDNDPYAIHEISSDRLTVDGTKKTYKDQYITLSVSADWLALEQHGEDGTNYFFKDPTSERCRLTFNVTGSEFAVHRTEAEYLALFSRWGYENVNILSCTKEKISGYDCTKVVYSYIEKGNAYIATRYDNVITGFRMYSFDIDYPAAESERFALVFESIMDSIVLKPC